MIFLFFLLFPCLCLAAEGASTGGAGRASLAPPSAKEEVYKTHAREGIARLADGRVDEAISIFEGYLEKHAGDLESLFGLAAAWAVKGDREKAARFFHEALDGGLPLSRFQAGPRELLKPLAKIPAVRAVLSERGRAIVHGPMVGAVTDRSARIWVRTGGEKRVRVFYGTAPDFADVTASPPMKTRAKEDFTARIPLEGLLPDTLYFYKVRSEGGGETARGSFRTFPPRGGRARFTVAFGGGAGYTPWKERMWKRILSEHPLALLLLGDNVYIDNPTRPAVQRYCYYRRQSRPEFRALCARVPLFSIWDDHDFITNDKWGGPEVDRPAWKIPVWRLFKENWNNPAYGGGEHRPGCWFDFFIGDVHFVLLDGRYYRTDPRAEHPSMLGPAQKAWLFRALGTAKANVTVLASPVPWSDGTKPGSLDTWEGFKEEREEIFRFIEGKEIPGVVLISADRHRSDAWRIDRPGGHTFYEFESSRLTNAHRHKVMAGALFGYNAKNSFGLLSFDTAKKKPEVRYRIETIDGEIVYDLTVKP